MSSEYVYPKAAKEVVDLLKDIYLHSGQLDVARLLEAAVPHFEYSKYEEFLSEDRIDFELILRVPVAAYAAVKDRVYAIQEDIAATIGHACPVENQCFIASVRILPAPSAAAEKTAQQVEEAATRIWASGRFRLFLSHLSRDKAQTHQLKDALIEFGISAFVAHDDIEPTEAWQTEIENALFSMHAMAVLLAPKLHESVWCNQEIGCALGKSILTIPLRLEGEVPKGFLGKYQGASIGFDNPNSAAADIFLILTRKAQTAGPMRDALIAMLREAFSFEEAKGIMTKMSILDGWTPKQIEEIRKARAENYQVRENFNVSLLSGIAPP